MKYFILMVLLSLSVGVMGEPHDMYTFKTPQQNQQFNQLIVQLRCLVCQNEDLADSDASLAADLRGEVATMVQQGMTSPNIKKYLVHRYGNYILFDPPVIQSTYLLWGLPLLMLIMMPIGLYLFIWKYRRR